MTEIGQLVIHFERDMPTRGYPYLGQVCLLGHSGPKKWDMHLTFRSSWSNDRQRDGGEQVRRVRDQLSDVRSQWETGERGGSGRRFLRHFRQCDRARGGTDPPT